MKIILFDLGNTLENNDELLPGAKELLSAIKSMQSANSHDIGLISDFDNFEQGLRLIDVKPLQLEYYNIIEKLKIRSYFDPLYKHVTLSTEIGIRKPDQRIFRAAIDLIEKDLPFESVLFITENISHINAARQLGLKAIHYKGPGQNSGEVEKLIDLIPLIEDFLNN